MASRLSEQQQHTVMQQQPIISLPQNHAPAGQQLASSLTSSTTSNQPMNSIPPTHTTSSVPMTTAYQSQNYIPSPAYQPESAAVTSAQLLPPAGQVFPTTGLPNGFSLDTSCIMATGQDYQVQGQPIVSMATPVCTTAPAPVSTPSFMVALPAGGHSEQMRRVREYQQYLLARHEQSKKVLAETKAEIKRRRENLLQRYPKLDLTRLEDLGAKYLENQPGEPIVSQQVSMAASTTVQHQVAYSADGVHGQSQAVPVTALLASLASHPYYAQTLSQMSSSGPTSASHMVNGVVAQTSIAQPDINFETNLRKNKFDNIRKSLPFDTDDSIQSPTVRVYEAYTSRQLDTTMGTDTTEADTSTSTERGSPQLKPHPKFEPLQEEESEGDMSSHDSVVSDRADSLTVRQEELLHQLAEIQRQKEEIMQRHAAGQERVQQKQDQLKAKLAIVSTGEQQTFRRAVDDKKVGLSQLQ